MKQTVEITREAAIALIGENAPCDGWKDTELASFNYYTAKGCKLVCINNFLSRTRQWYIQDINA